MTKSITPTAESILQSFTLAIETDDDGERLYDYVDEETGREFQVEYYLYDRSSPRYRLSETQPTGRVAKSGESAIPFHDLEVEIGPNALMEAIKGENIPLETLRFSASGFRNDSLIYVSLAECALAIEKAIVDNVRYDANRENSIRDDEMQQERIDTDEPTLDYLNLFCEGVITAVRIAELYVPRHLRGGGIGTKKIEDFENGLPATVQRVSLIAANLGTGNTEQFWAARGFSLVFDMSDAPEKANKHIYTFMHKGVNGYPTPAPLPWVQYDASYADTLVVPMMPLAAASPEDEATVELPSFRM